MKLGVHEGHVTGEQEEHLGSGGQGLQVTFLTIQRPLDSASAKVDIKSTF